MSPLLLICLANGCVVTVCLCGAVQRRMKFLCGTLGFCFTSVTAALSKASQCLFAAAVPDVCLLVCHMIYLDFRALSQRQRPSCET